MSRFFKNTNIQNSIPSSIAHLIGVNGMSYLILLLISIVIFRTVDKSYYGLYVIMLSIFAVIELLMAGFNDSIVRFLKDKISLDDKQNIVLFVLYYKYFLIFSFIGIIYIARKYGFFEFLIGNYGEVIDLIDSFLLVAILNSLLSAFIGVNNCILNAQLQYKLTANIDFIRNLCYLLIVITLSFFTQDYLNYLYSSVVLSFVVLMFLSIKINQDFSEFSLISLIRAKFSIDIGKKYIFPYAMPLTGSSLLTFVKNHLPTLILGKEFALEDVAVFSILKTFFKALHSVSGSFINPMMSKFLDLKNNVEEFSLKMNAIFSGTFFLRLFLFAIVSFLMQYFFLIYRIEDNEVNQFIFYVLGLEYLIAGMILSFGIILRLNKTTNKVLVTSIVRFVVELTLIFLILLDYGIMAAALILLVARYVETVVTYFFIRRQRIFKKSGFVLLTIALPVAYFLYKLPSVPY
ncbi:oligosaccharide flippase family protein [Candidatus Pseudothioglobus singularis]|jgi:O-antigen/teichoic acid export membrane protein|nr:oligosaccharide flippase family protein [Candidatus Pseudothioglobus singularis]